MSSILKVDTIQDTSGNNIINENANTVTIGKSGDTVNVVGTLQNGGTNFLQGITEADQWRLTADFSGEAIPITSNLARVSTDGFGYIGTGMTQSSGIFTFPSTGVYMIHYFANFQLDGDDRGIGIEIQTTTNNSTYDTAAAGITFIQQTSGTVTYSMAYCNFMFDVTNTSTHKCRFSSQPVNASTVTNGSGGYNRTTMTFIRLGDT